MLRLANKKIQFITEKILFIGNIYVFFFSFFFVLLEMIRLIKEYVPGPISQLVHQYV